MPSNLTLSLLVGPAVPVPVPRAVLEALTAAEVTTTAERGKPSGFRLTFTLSKRSPLHTVFVLAAGALPPIMRVVLVVTVNGIASVLVDGIVTKQEVSPAAAGSYDNLQITGVDISAVMNWIEGSGTPYPALPIEGRVAVILARYVVFGFVPKIIPTLLFEAPIPTDKIPAQKGNDWEYVNELAAEVGYVFFVEPGPVPGLNTAYFGPDVKLGTPQPALSVNMDGQTNVESLSFALDNEEKTLPVTFVQDLLSKVPIPIPLPDINLLNPLLGLIPLLAKRVEYVKDSAKRSPIQAALFAMAQAAGTADGVTGQGSLDVLRYGRPLRARALVGVRGAGPAFDGVHYVQQVTHRIKRGEYKQEFKLVRNGLLSTLPRVPA
jgi:hypothetical protein